jgi:hypothetical protein
LAALCLLVALCLPGVLLSACSLDTVDANILEPGYLGRLIDQPPPPITVSRGGPSGDLLASPVVPLMPPETADKTVAEALRNWLTPIEREGLASASQAAVAAPTGSIVPWQAVDGTGAVTARGTVIPLADVFKSGHGPICRVVRETAEKAGTTHVQQASLCRADEGDGLIVWRVARVD